MTALTTTRSPTSYQLRSAAVNCRKYPSPSRFLRMHVQKLDYQIRCFCSYNDNVSKQRMKNSKFCVNAFSGWSGDDNGTEVLNESNPKKEPSRGIVGAAIAGVVLVGGLAFATLSISKRMSGPKTNMETLTAHQEESLTSADQNDNVKDEITETKNDVEDNEKDNNDFAYEKEYENATENLGRNTDIEGKEVADEVSNQQDLQERELPKSEVADNVIDSSVTENLDNDPVTEKIESSNDIDDSADDKDKPYDVDGIRIGSFDSYVDSVNLDTGSPEEEDTAINVISVIDTKTEQVTVILDPQSPHEEDENGDFFDKEAQVFSREYMFSSEQNNGSYNDNIEKTTFDSMDLAELSSSASIPAPSVLSPALQGRPGKVLVPAAVDQIQGQALAALQVLKVIEGDVQPGDLCTRREYARWLVTASSALSRNTLSKVYPAMCIENVTELAFDDITPEDPDFSSIQGLAEAGLIASKLSQRDMNIDESSLNFFPESPLSRQDLVSWKMSLEKRLLPIADRKILQQLSGFIDIDKINSDAWPALIADLSAGENGIVSLAFGYTRLFQPDKPVTNAQAAIALATGEASEIVNEELTRIEAETMAEKAVAAHSALVDQVQKDVNTYYENDLLLERQKIVALEKLAEETKQELERLKAEQEEQNIKIMKERAGVDSQMEVLSKLRHETEEELQKIMSNKVEISYEKERINKLRIDAETENKKISRLQYELEVERKALALARTWAEDEAKRAREQAKVLEDARDRWESKGIKVIVDNDLRDETVSESTWLNSQNQFPAEETKTRAENLVDKLKSMAADITGKSRDIINNLIEKVLFFISQLKELASRAVNQAGLVKDSTVTKVNSSVRDLQQSAGGFGSAVTEGAKRVVGDCREGVEKLSQKFKT